jgi:hypothetical protein
MRDFFSTIKNSQFNSERTPRNEDDFGLPRVRKQDKPKKQSRKKPSVAPKTPSGVPDFSGLPPGFKLKSSLDDQGLDPVKAVALHHETTMVACLWLIHQDYHPESTLTQFLDVMRSSFSLHDRPFKIDAAHVAIVAAYLATTGTDPNVQYGISKRASTDKFFKQLCVQNSAEGVSYITFTLDDVQHAVVEQEAILEEGAVPATLNDNYADEVNAVLIDAFMLGPRADSNTVVNYVEEMVARPKILPPKDNTSFSVSSSYPGLLQTNPVPRGDVGNMALAVMELDKLFGDEETIVLVRDSPVASAHDPFLPGCHPAARIVPLGKSDSSPSISFCAFSDRFEDVKAKFFAYSQEYEHGSKAFRDSSTVYERLTSPYKENRDYFQRVPIGQQRGRRYFTAYQKGISSAVEIASNPGYLHISNISNFTVARRDGYLGTAYVIDPRTFLTLVISDEIKSAIEIDEDGSVTVPIRTGSKAVSLSQVTYQASVALLVESLYPDKGYRDKMGELVRKRGASLHDYYLALLARVSFYARDRRTLVVIPWYKYKLFASYVEVDEYLDELGHINDDLLFPRGEGGAQDSEITSESDSSDDAPEDHVQNHEPPDIPEPDGDLDADDIID